MAPNRFVNSSASRNQNRSFQESSYLTDSSGSDTSLERSCLATSTAIIGETVADSPTSTNRTMVLLRERSALGVPSSTTEPMMAGGVSQRGDSNSTHSYTSTSLADSMGVGIMAQGLAWANRQQERRQRRYLQHQAEHQLRKIKQAQDAMTSATTTTQEHRGSLQDNYTFRNFFSQTSIDSKKCDDAVSAHSNDSMDDTISKRISKSGGGYSVELAALSQPKVTRKQDDESWIPPVRVVPEDDPPFCLSQNQMQSIAETVLPRGIAYCQWTRLYSLARDGDSFETCLNFVGTQKPTLLVVRTTKNEVFGGLADESWQPASAVVQYCGGPTACLFTINQDDDNTVTPYKWTGANRYIQLCDAANQRLAFGGGGDEFGLAVSHDFLFGSTGPSATFGNPPLCDTSPFDICDLEVYGFLIGQF